MIADVHAAATGSAAKPYPSTAGEPSLARWCVRQRAVYAAGTLDSGFARRLEALPVWIWEKGETGKYDRGTRPGAVPVIC